jgi:hypothetical protein
MQAREPAGLGVSQVVADSTTEPTPAVRKSPRRRRTPAADKDMDTDMDTDKDKDKDKGDDGADLSMERVTACAASVMMLLLVLAYACYNGGCRHCIQQVLWFLPV